MHSFDPSTSPAAITAVLSALRPHLPCSLPLYRRIQFAHFSPSARILTSFPPSSSTSPATPWVACFSDPDRGPETQVHVFGSWEADPRQEADEELVRELLVELLREGGYAPARRSEAVQAREAAVDGYDAAGDERHLVLMGSVHERTARIVAGLVELELGWVKEDGLPNRWNKWVFDLREVCGEMKDLPDGLRWGTMGTKHYEVVRARTSIPRKDRTLSMLPQVAIFPTDRQDDEGNPVAWLFLGVDSSLTTLHVEPEYRGKGLAKALAYRAWAEHLDSYRTNFAPDGEALDERWAHADVAEDNTSSNAVCKSLGGKIEWADYWMKIDLTKMD